MASSRSRMAGSLMMARAMEILCERATRYEGRGAIQIEIAALADLTLNFLFCQLVQGGKSDP